MRITLKQAPLALAALSLVALAGGRPAGAQTTTTVYVYSFDFTTDPSLLTEIDPVINVGDTIVWQWVQGPVAPNAPHDVVSVDGLFHSGPPVPAIAPPQANPTSPRFEYTFTQVGDFEYYCEPHRDMGMVGRITVVPEPGTYALIASGLLPLAGAARRRRRG